MRKISVSAFVFLVSALTLSNFVAAQEPGPKTQDDTCEQPIYKASEVLRRATVTSRSHPDLTAEALANGVRGRVVLSAVLCRSGRVTDIQVLEGLPFGMTERAIVAARESKFTPAEKDGRAVSQMTRFEFRFSYIGERRPLAQGPLLGRMIESIEIVGVREELGNDIWDRLKSRGGELYNEKHIEQDWQMLLGLGDYDKEQSTLLVEEGERGGVRIVFQFKERSGR